MNSFSLNSEIDFIDNAFVSKGSPTIQDVQVTAVDAMPLEGKSVLIVDSALGTRRALQEQASNLGAKSVQFCSSVAEVAKILEERNFALIICEYQLDGEKNGQQFLEDLRTNKKLPWDTAFMMVTAERKYANVISVAEFTPDDYLIKPFTASNLSKRIIKIFNKKNSLSGVHKAIADEEYTRVPELCRTLSRIHPKYRFELERISIESLHKSGQVDEARGELNKLLSTEPKPWMLMLLGKIQLENKEFEDAAIVLNNVTKDRIDFLQAFDHYAETLWELNRPEEALEVLEQLGEKALASTSRLRRLVDLSLRIGDHTRSKNYLIKLIDRSRNTSFAQMHDYLQLAMIFTREGRHEEAERLTSKLKNVVNSDELDFARKIMSIQRLTQEGDLEGAKANVLSMLESQSDLINKLEPDAKITVLEQCFLIGLEEEGYKFAGEITKSNPRKALLDRIRTSISTKNSLVYK